MKKIVLLLIAGACASMSAQTDPLTQFFNRSFIPNIIVHDSITVSLDSGSAFTPVSTGTQHYFVNGKIDTLTITQNGMVAAVYDGKSSNGYRSTVLAGYSVLQQDSIDKTVYELDQNFRDSSLTYYEYMNGSFDLFFRAINIYDTSGKTSRVDVYADLGTGSLSKIGDYRFFYNQTLLDSVFYTISLTGGGNGFFKYTYAPNDPSKLLKMEAYEDVDNDGERDLIQQILCKTNSLNQVIEVTDLQADNNFNLLIAGVVRYNKRTNSTIGLQNHSALKVSLYPNPATNFLHLEYDAREMHSYKITNSVGQTLLSGPMSTTVNISALPLGVYRISFDNQSVQRFVKK